ncbi:Peroxisomal membrane protein 11A [Hibiscus syriacus]|uniref:Peroxisomal membrane protein 11A n=1 Tax=Hibiscus syriacus TaxID=106335 RepID=A0A6A2XH80_HIBSY|nr:Peroxisomal membrane protein 11A [Hibiscus syriacus]
MDSKATTVAPAQPQSKAKEGDFLNHLEAYLVRRDGVDNLLKISRNATKIILASSVLPETAPLTGQFKSFESSVGLSRKAFGSGNSFKTISLKLRELKRMNEEEASLNEEEASLNSSIKMAILGGVGCKEEEERGKKLRAKKLMKQLSVVQDLCLACSSLFLLDDALLLHNVEMYTLLVIKPSVLPVKLYLKSRLLRLNVIGIRVEKIRQS